MLSFEVLKATVSNEKLADSMTACSKIFGILNALISKVEGSLDGGKGPTNSCPPVSCH